MDVFRPQLLDSPESSRLPRKTLQTQLRKPLLIRTFGGGLIASILIAALSFFIWTSYASRGKDVRFDPGLLSSYDGSCESYTADDTQKVFIIDSVLATDLSYAGARGIDIAWDLVVCQGGRILHAWVFCLCVAPAVLTRLLERATLPYPALINLSFSASSLKALWSTLKLMLQRPRHLPTIIWLFLAIGYCLLFPTVWGAVTGYFQPSAPMWQMPDGSFVNISSGLLRQCWVFDDPRLPDLGLQVVTGNTYSSLDNAWVSGMAVPTDPVVSEGNETAGLYTADYLDFTAYVETQTFLQLALSSWCDSSDSRNTALANLSSIYRPNMTIDEYTIDFSVRQSPPYPNCSLPDEVGMLQICGPSQHNCAPTVRHLNISTTNINDITLFPPMAYNGTSTARAQRDASVAVGPYTRMPYNSTLWFNNTRYDLSAPTIDPIVGCKTYNGLTCSCYNGEPITYDYQRPDHTQCISSSTYSWGLSTTIAIIAAALELAWIIGCYGVWLDAELNSTLIRHCWKAAGDVKSAMTIAARIESDLGPEAYSYSQDELKKALKDCDDVGHQVLGSPDETVEIGILTARDTPSRRRQLATEKGSKLPVSETNSSLLSDFRAGGKRASDRSIHGVLTWSIRPLRAKRTPTGGTKYDTSSEDLS